MIKILVDETQAQLVGLDNLTVIDSISSQLSYMVPGSQYSQLFRMGKWDGRERLLTKQLKFPSGLVEQVCAALKSFDVPYEVIESFRYPPGPLLIPALAPQPYPYQLEVIKIALDKKGGTIQVATGGGKSIIIAYLACALGVSTMIYVVSLDLMIQLHSTIESALGIKIGMIGGGHCSIEKITVCSVWTAGLACGEKIAKSEDDEDSRQDSWSPSTAQRGDIVSAVRGAQAVMLDESQFAAATSIRMILKNSVRACYKYGFSATPWRSSGDDILLEAAFGKKICSISGTELIEQGYLVRPKIVFRDIPRHKTKLAKNWPSVKSNYIVNNDVRNDILVKNVLKLIEMGRKPLMLFRDIKHGQILHDLVSEHARPLLINGESPEDDRLDLKRKFLGGEADVIISSGILDQGFDLPALDALVLCGGGKSSAKALQRVGRVLRTNKAGGKTDAIIVDTFDQSFFVNDHAVARHKAYLTEPGFVVKVEPAMDAFLKKTTGGGF